MAKDIIELSRRAFATFERGDIDAFLEQVDPEVEFTSLIAEAEATVYHGHQGVRDWWEMVSNAVGGLRFDVEEFQRGEDPNVGLVKMRVVGEVSGVEIGQTMWQAVYAPDEMAVWWGIFRTEQEAREAGGAAALRGRAN